MKEYEKRSISEIVEEVNRIYFLPDIQRDFVWKPEQVYKLFDSILREYPIGTFLFWILKGEFLQREKIKKLEFPLLSDNENLENTSFNSEKDYYLVLDGQQRLTSFYLVLKGNYVIRNKACELYYNVLSGVTEEEDDILYEFKFFDRDKGKTFIDKDKDGKVIKAWYLVKNIYDVDMPFKIVNIMKTEIEDKYEISLSDLQRENCQKLAYSFKSIKLIYFYPETSPDYDKVLDIFVRTNSGGTKLGYSDLLFSTIKSKWNKARENFNELLSTINDNEKFSFDTDFILKTLLLYMQMMLMRSDIQLKILNLK